MCSGLTPIPINHAGKPLSGGNQSSSFTANGGFGRSVPASTRRITRFWMTS
jgi:hypothetical protein